MILNFLNIAQVRNISQAEGEISPHFNLFYGLNGSGKTSILESLFLLTHGRSFRTRKMDRVIQSGKEELWVRGVLGDPQGLSLTMGVKRGLDGTVQFKLGQEDIKQCGELARQYPLLLINPDSYRLLEMGPFYRRQFMDWGLFHVEHEFHGLWQRFQRILKQRNEGLRQRLKAPLLKAWDESFVALAEAIDEKRRHYLEGFLEIFHPILEKWSPTKGISLHYQRGWAQKSDLTTLLAQNLEKDYGTGHTTYGPHRGDLVMKVGGYQAHEVLSRGQQKLLLFALRLTQGRLLKELTGKGCGYLVDDLTAELDEIHQERVVNWFFEEGFQVFVTGVDAAPFVSLFKDKIAHRFHVEHGVVSRQA